MFLQSDPRVILCVCVLAALCRPTKLVTSNTTAAPQECGDDSYSMQSQECAKNVVKVFADMNIDVEHVDGITQTQKDALCRVSTADELVAINACLNKLTTDDQLCRDENLKYSEFVASVCGVDTSDAECEDDFYIGKTLECAKNVVKVLSDMNIDVEHADGITQTQKDSLCRVSTADELVAIKACVNKLTTNDQACTNVPRKYFAIIESICGVDTSDAGTYGVPSLLLLLAISLLGRIIV